MGIAHLKQHLQPYASGVWLGTRQAAPAGVKQIASVVIDGPSLVYHVYHSLFSKMEERFNAVDIQPSNDEVSIGTMRFLLLLRDLNVAVRRIYFDGALPLPKRPTRLNRLERSRTVLEILCRVNPTGFHPLSVRREPLKIDAWTVFKMSFSGPTNRRNVPANPFMVPAVIEDLKYRWNWKRINEYAPDAARPDEDPESFPWADITEVVPGEADVYVAEAAKVFDASVLTGDSDLLLHDLGPNGSVIFYDSIQTVESEPSESYQLIASELSQTAVSKRFGLTNFQRLGFELQTNPGASMMTLVQRSKEYSDPEPSDLYHAFLKEYEAPSHRHMPGSEQAILDPRVLELCLQYEIPELRSDSEAPHVYLPLMIENHARRCAWAEGREIRTLGYSLFDVSFSKVNVSQRVMEYYRKGERVTPTAVALLGRKNIESAVTELLQRINSIDLPCGKETVIFWKVFALNEIWCPSEKNNNPVLDSAGIKQFLEKGHAGGRVSWEDLHLHAQVHAVLYSLKMLKDLATATLPRLDGIMKESTMQVLDSLSELPTMRNLLQSRCDLRSEPRPEGSVERAVQALSKLLGQNYGDCDSGSDKASSPSQVTKNAQEKQSSTEEEFRTSTPRRNKKKRPAPATGSTQRMSKKSMNIYDILGDTN